MDFRGVEAFLEETHERLRKDTAKTLEDHETYFEALDSSINKIFSYGFSFSGVDEIYIKELCKRLPAENVIWYPNDYEDDAIRVGFQDIIAHCGFKGVFDTFTVRK